MNHFELKENAKLYMATITYTNIAPVVATSFREAEHITQINSEELLEDESGQCDIYIAPIKSSDDIPDYMTNELCLDSKLTCQEALDIIEEIKRKKEIQEWQDKHQLKLPLFSS